MRVPSEIPDGSPSNKSKVKTKRKGKACKKHKHVAPIAPEQRIRAIETPWHGHRFRSRLEARWAIFFTTLKIEFWYEPEGFDLGGGEWYLPDFYLPQLKIYVEVKPEALLALEMRRAQTLACKLGRHVLLLVGPPDFRRYDVIFSAGDGYFTPADAVLDVYQFRKQFQEGRLNSCLGHGFDSEDFFSPVYKQAVYIARGERFGGEK